MKQFGLLAACIAAFSIGADAQIFGGSVASGRVFNASCSAGEVPTYDSNHRLTGCGSSSGTGTVTNVAMTGISGIINVGGSPITTTGTFALSLANQVARRVFIGPDGGADAAPTFRALVTADIPSAFGTLATHQSGSPIYCRSTSGNDTYACSLTPALTALTRGMVIHLDADTANTGTATVNINSLGATSILDRSGSALADGAIAANRGVLLYYNGTNFSIIGDGNSGGAGSLTVQSDGTATANARAILNLISGTGILVSCVDNSGATKNDCTFQFDTSYGNSTYLRLNATNTAGSSFKGDLRAASTTDGFAFPASATASPTTSAYCGFGTNDLLLNCGRNGSTESIAWRDVSLAPLLIARTNAGTTGTTVNLLAKINASGQAVVTGTSDTNGAVGVVVSGAGTSGTAKIAYSGVVDCVADNATTIGNYVILGSSTAGRCRDGGATYPTSGQVVGRFLTSVSGGASASVLLFGLGQQGSSGGGGLADPGGNGVVVRTSSGVTTNRTITGTTDEITVTNGDGVSGNPTISLPSTINASSKVFRVPNSTTLPATCTVGDVYMDTDATSGQRIYACESTNTWVKQGDGNAGTAYFMRMGSQRVNASSTSYAGFAVDGFNGTESTVQGRTLGGTATELRINPGGFQPGDGALVCTLRQNGSDTALTVTLAAGSNSSTKGTGSVSITDGAQLSIGCANAASSGQSATISSFLLRII